MAELPSSTSKSNPRKVLMETGMTEIQHLMQRSDEDNNTNSSSINNKRNKDTDENVDQRPREINSEKIGEISDEEEAYRPLKTRKHRSLVSIYMATKPMSARYGKKVRS